MYLVFLAAFYPPASITVYLEEQSCKADIKMILVYPSFCQTGLLSSYVTIQPSGSDGAASKKLKQKLGTKFLFMLVLASKNLCYVKI